MICIYRIIEILESRGLSETLYNTNWMDGCLPGGSSILNAKQYYSQTPVESISLEVEHQQRRRLILNQFAHSSYRTRYSYWTELSDDDVVVVDI